MAKVISNEWSNYFRSIHDALPVSSAFIARRKFRGEPPKHKFVDGFCLFSFAALGLAEF
jgi:hypothetical protein